MQALQGRIFPSSFSLFPLPKEAGTDSADKYDQLFSSSLQSVYNNLVSIPIIKVPANLAAGAQKALFSLFGRYQLDPSGGSSSHPQLDSFRRICDRFVFDTYGQQNIIEVGSSLTRMAARPTMCAAHTCSPNLDGRDRARAAIAANIANNNANHPFQAELVARGNMEWINPAWMCGNKGQDCQVPGRVLYSSYSLQDEPPKALEEMMDAHNSSIALVALQLPVPLVYVNKFQEVDTGARWEAFPDKDEVVCYPGFGDAGYVHKLSNIKKWMNGFQDTSLFCEILYQYGSSVLFRFSRNGTNAGTQHYPVLIRTMMEKYALIGGDAHGIPEFLTSASHYDRLVRYLMTHFAKGTADMFQLAFERVSVLTPAIVLGDDKYSDRWVLDADQSISIAYSACLDVQKMMHRSTLAQRRLEVDNSKMATESRRVEAAAEPTLLERVFARLRNEEVITSTRTLGDWFADTLDYRAGNLLHQTTHLPDSMVIQNGSARVGDDLGDVEAPVGAPIPNIAQPGGGHYIAPGRVGYPNMSNWWPGFNEAWLAALQGLPVARRGQMIADFDPAANLLQARNQLNGAPLNQLRQLQDRALANWDWDVASKIDLFIVGPAGTGKSTHARRISPPGTIVVVPTNELMMHWQRVYPGHPIITLDDAIANLNIIRAAPAIIIDEVYQFPVGHVITLASQNIPLIAIGCPAQRRYNGNLGARFDHTIVPIDYHCILTTIQRNGQDVVDLMNRHTLQVYRQEFGPMFDANQQFVTAHPGVQNIQNGLVNRPGLHLTFHRANTTVYNGCITIDSSQGTDARDVFVHLYPGDEIALAQNPYAFTLALTRCINSITFTVPNGTRQNAPIVQAMIQRGLTNAQLVRRQNNVFGSRYSAVIHGFTSLDDLDCEDADEPEYWSEAVDRTKLKFAGRDLVDDNEEDEAPLECVVSPAINEALYQLHPEPPQPSDLHRDKSLIRLRKPDPACRIRVPEWMQTKDLFDPTNFIRIGYPFSNTEVLASVVAVFDRYTKPQNIAIPNKRAHMLADIMFDRWVDAFINKDAVVRMPTTAAMFSNWFSNAKALRIAQVAAELPFIDSGRPLQNEYFLKCQCKAKFKAFGFCAECGQGILATNKLMNATICPLIVAATKECQARLRSNVIYDSGYSAEQLDAAVRATGALDEKHHLSSDLSQQDSSHVNVHRFFIAKVMAFLGFDDTIITLYLMSRARRMCKGLTMLGLLFEVIERLFSGEPGTAFFNWLMNGGTVACTVNLVNPRPKLIMGKGDDISVSPKPKMLKLAINMAKATAVTLKMETFPYLDFANRIWTTTGRSFADPARMLAKYTMRMTSRDNTEAEWQAYADQRFVMTPTQFEQVVAAIEIKHKVNHDVAHDITAAVLALHNKSAYYGSLRASKVPVDHMPVLRKSGAHDVVFEDLKDRCAPAAIAFIADCPISEVISYVNRLRLRRPAHPDTRSANHESIHAGAFFMDDIEIRSACTKFGVRLAGADLSLKVEGGHVVVVRAKLSWRTQRFARANRLFGSLTHWETGLAVVVAALCFYGLIARWNLFYAELCLQVNWVCAGVVRHISTFMVVMSPGAFLISLVPVALLCNYGWWRWALWLFIISQICCRLFLMPFHYRALTQMKKVKALRIEHAVYGSARKSVRSYKIDQVFFLIGLVALALFGYNACQTMYYICLEMWVEKYLDPMEFLVQALMYMGSSVQAATFIVFGVGHVSAIFLEAVFGIKHWALDLALFSFSIYEMSIPSMLAGIVFFVIPRFMFTQSMVKYFRRVFLSPHMLLLWANLAIWITWLNFVWLMFKIRTMPSKEDEYNEYMGSRYQQRQTPPQEEYDEFTDRCLHNARRPMEKWCRERMQRCHPDKRQADTDCS